jgi:hypothetical protein
MPQTEPYDNDRGGRAKLLARCHRCGDSEADLSLVTGSCWACIVQRDIEEDRQKGQGNE